MKRFKNRLLAVGVLLIVISCKTYTIPVETFREQMIGETSENVKNTLINNPLFYRDIKYNSNNIRQIIVTDKDGNRTFLDNSPSIELRVTDVNSKKYQFYFDTVILENDTLKGGRSRFLQGLTREIPMDSIVKIEIQDGGKKYNYRN